MKNQRITERVVFRLITTPCCGRMMCLLGSRYPNFCQECAKPMLGAIRTQREKVIIEDRQALLTYNAGEHNIRFTLGSKL